jgi:hypothetical protein
MLERDPHKRGDKDFQEVCFALSKTFYKLAETINPLFDFDGKIARHKHSAMKARCTGLINQNPSPESIKSISRSS